MGAEELATGSEVRRRLVVSDVVVHDAYLRCDDSAPRRARSWVAEILQMRPAHEPPPRLFLGDDLALCVSELVSASLLASCSTISLRLSVERDHVRVSLVDDCRISGDAHDPLMHAQRFALEIIERISDGSGMRPVPGGREVWAIFLDGTTANLPV